MSTHIQDYISIPSAPVKVVPRSKAVAPPVASAAEPPSPPSLSPSYSERMATASAQGAQRRFASVPHGIPKTQYKAVPQVELPDGMSELPLLSKDDPASKQLQERLIAKVRVFDLANPVDIEDCQRVWQLVCDGQAQISSENTHFDEKNAKYLTLLRWSEFAYKLPGT